MSTAGFPQNGDPSPEIQRLFLEDTIEVQVGDRSVIGVVTRTWSDLDGESVEWEEIDEAIPGAKATHNDILELQKTGQPPRGFLLFSPSSPFDSPMLVHESECKLLDRALMFGDVVKQSSSVAQSGTVIAVDSTVTLRPSYFDPGHPELWPPNVEIKDVRGSELDLVSDWNHGDFVIYKNSWMGLVEDVMEDVWLKLQDDSVVIVEDPGLLNSTNGPVLDGSSDTQMTGNGTDVPRATANRSAPKNTRAPAGDEEEDMAILCPGHMVTTTKANLRRGRWVYGSYNAGVPPTGIIVQVKPVSLLMNWICQNPMVEGRFVPIPPPPRQIDLDEDGDYLTRFKKSTGGLKDINGMLYNDLIRSSGGAELQVGDRVRFLDIDQAEQKFPGKIKKIPRRSVQGFEVNIFVVTETRTLVRVQWQDMTETTEETRALIPYLNVDEHDVWPGEIVIVKPETVAVTGSATSPPTAQDPSPPGADADYIKPSRVGVVQVADPAGRVAKVKWFKNPRLEVIAGVLVPGSKIGELEEAAEDASFYEIIAHPAIGLRRGDFVLIKPEGLILDVEQPTAPQSAPTVPAQAPANPDAEFLAQNNITEEQIQQLQQVVRQQFPDERLIANLSATLRNHPHPSLQAMARMLTDVSDPAANGAPPVQEELPAGYENFYVGQPTDWIGEVVSLGLDGQATIRMGGLKAPRDVELPIDRLHVIFNDDMDLAGGLDSDDGEESDGWEDGNSEGWTTEEEIEGDDVEMEDVEFADVEEDEEAPAAPGVNAEPVPRTPPPIPENMPAPEAITLPSIDGAPSRFAVLDTPVPTDHHYLDKPGGTTSALLKRIVREQKILAQSLPEGIFVRTWESRMDLLRVLIVGPLNTPYELAPFVFDFYMPDTFPAGPPSGFFHSWTHGIGRVNPNLYEDGNICLSLLGTWHAERSNETWSVNSTILQLLVSLMGLVLVREPWYNEAGFSIYQGSADVSLSSQLYSEKAFMLARGFVRYALEHPVQGFEDVVGWLYLKKAPEGPGLLAQVLERAKKVVERSEGPEAEKIGIDDTPEGVGRVSKGALVMLKRDLEALEKRLESL